MTTISIIGSGNMATATAIGTRAARHGHTVELMSRNTAKAQVLADQIGHGAAVGASVPPIVQFFTGALPRISGSLLRLDQLAVPPRGAAHQRHLSKVGRGSFASTAEVRFDSRKRALVHEQH